MFVFFGKENKGKEKRGWHTSVLWGSRRIGGKTIWNSNNMTNVHFTLFIKRTNAYVCGGTNDNVRSRQTCMEFMVRTHKQNNTQLVGAPNAICPVCTFFIVLTCLWSLVHGHSKSLTNYIFYLSLKKKQVKKRKYSKFFKFFKKSKIAFSTLLKKKMLNFLLLVVVKINLI